MVTAVMVGRSVVTLAEAIAAYRQARYTFTYQPGTGRQLAEAEAELRRVGLDRVSGLVTLPICAVHFSDVRADGARMVAVCGGSGSAEVWVSWSGRSLRFGVESRTYGPWDLVQVRA